MSDVPRLPNHPRFRAGREQFLCADGNWEDLDSLSDFEREEEVAAVAVCGKPEINIVEVLPPDTCAECARLRARLAAMTILAGGGK